MRDAAGSRCTGALLERIEEYTRRLAPAVGGRRVDERAVRREGRQRDGH